jgi:multiple antibiotic resistance protein
VVIDPVGDAPIFELSHHICQNAEKIWVAIEGSKVAAAIMLFFAIYGSCTLQNLAISSFAFKLAGGIFLLLVALDMLSNRRQQQRKEQRSDITSQDDKIAIFPLAIPLLASPAVITSLMMVSSGAAGSQKLSLLGVGALASVMAITTVILIASSLVETYITIRVTTVFSLIAAFILADLSIQYIIDGLQTLEGLPIS